MQSRSWRLALAVAFLLALSFALPAGHGEAVAQQGQKPVQAQKPGNGGGGKGGGGKGGGDATSYAVDVTFGTGVSAAGAVSGAVDETFSALENESPNPAPEYYLGAAMEAPPQGDGLVEMTIDFTDVAYGPNAPAGALTCGDFFVNHADGDGVDGLPNVDYDFVNGTGSWTGLAYVRIYLDEGTSVDDPQLGWRDLDDTGPRGAKVRMNGFLRTETLHPNGKKTITETTNLFSLRFDDDYDVHVEEYSQLYADLGVRADDLEAMSTGTDGDGNSDSWWIYNGAGGTDALIHTNSGSAALAVCGVSGVSWSAVVPQ